MKTLRILCIGLLAIFAAACRPTSDDRNRLNNAEHLIGSNPDSALFLLNNISARALDDELFGAKVAVVKAEAHYKTRQPLPDDSVFSHTISILSKAKPNSYLSRAYFLNGYRKIGESRYIDAIVDLLMAEDISDDIGDIHVKGLAQRNIGDAFDKMDDNGSALTYYRRSAQTFRADPDSIFYYWGLLNIARGYNNVSDYESAIDLTDSILGCEFVKHNPALYQASVNNLAVALLNDNKNQEALNLFRNLREMGWEFRDVDFYNMGRAYLNLGMITEARACSDSVKVFNPKDTSLDFSIACVTKDNNKFYSLVRNEITDANDNLESIYKRNYAEVIDRFYKQAVSEREGRLQHSRTQLYVLIIGGVVAVLALLVVAFAIIRRRDARNNQTLSLVHELSTSIQSQNRDMDKLREGLEEGAAQQDNYRRELKNQISAKLAAFDEICDIYSDTTENTLELVRRIKSFISKNATKKDLEEIAQHINKYEDGLISDFSTDFPTLKETDRAMFILIVAGFKSPAVALYLGTDIKNIYSRRYKLKQKLLTLNPEKAPRYVVFI